MTATITPSRITPADLLRVGVAGLRERKLRAALSAAGIAIGIAAIVSVLGISQSSGAALQHQLDQLGTNLLTVQPGQTFAGQATTLPLPAEQMIGRISSVQQVSAVAVLPNETVLRNRFINPVQTGGIQVMAARAGLLPVLRGHVAQGVFLNAATARYPVTVLGAVAAQQLGIGALRPGTAVWLGGQVFTVAGVLAPLPLAPDLDRAALIGYPEAHTAFSADGSASTIYVRAQAGSVQAAFGLLGPTANPAHPDQVQVSQPSAALQAQIAATTAFNSLFLGLGGVALLVGGVGIANVMVISVLERRSEIGLRRALGAGARHIWAQFLIEALALAALGGLAGSALGAAATAGYARYQHWQIVIPANALELGIGASLAIGAIAGLYPAVRAARLTPTQALRTT
jgi:putative ABC transport system permease protein